MKVRKEETRQKDVAVRKEKTGSDKPTQLRRRAEKLLDGNPEAMEEMPFKDVRNLIEELRIHQIELEMQNDELRRSQLELQEARDNYLALYDFAPVGYFAISEKGIILGANLTGAAMLAMERGLLIGRPFSRFISRDNQDIFYLEHKKLSQTKIRQTFDLKLRRKDGSEFYARLEGVAAADAEGNVHQLRITVSDVSDSRQAEEALRRAHEELEARVEERTAELVRINEELKREVEERKRTQQALRKSEERVRKVNVAFDQGLSEVFQALRKIASGDPSVRIPETSELDMLVKLKQAVNVTARDLATIINLTHEFAMGLTEYFDVLQRVSRGDFTARVSGDSPIDLLEALKRHINQMIQDISTEIAERKRVEQTLRERQASLAEAQHIAHLGNWDWNIETNELRWSDEIYRIFGLTPQEFGATYESFLNSVHPDDREAVKKAVEEALYDEKPYSIDHRIVLPDGTERIVQEQAGTTFDNEGKPIRMIGTVQNITERKKAEQALEESEAALRRLSARLLRVQEAERETISRELHDSIGQSLAAIKFGVENCLHKIREAADKETVKSLEALVPVVLRASEEVRRIHTDLRPSLLDDLGIIATISWFCREFQGLYSGIRVEQRIDIEEKQVADSLKIVIFRLLQEALNNVAKYGKGDTVRVSLQEKEGYIELAIEDNGRGFDVDQVRSTKSLKGGFGLTSMKERTELSGGSFSIESVPGAGTLVRASWPTRITEPA